MQKATQLFLLVVLFLFVSQNARAAVLIEPLVGFNFGSKLSVDNDDIDEDYSGLGGAYGGRLGYQNLGFQLGLDYLHSSLDMDDSTLKKNVSMNEWAAFVGFEFPVLLRVYAGYIFSVDGSTEYQASKNSSKKDFDIKSGSGAKFGLGFTVLPFLDINVEYRRGTIDEYKVGKTKYEDDMDYSSYMVGVSLPFAL